MYIENNEVVGGGGGDANTQIHTIYLNDKDFIFSNIISH